MSNSASAQRPITDAELIELVASVTPEDYERIDPPAHLWTSVLIAARDETIKGSLGASRADSSPKGSLWSSAVLKVAAAVILIAGVGAVVTGQFRQGPEPMTIASASMDDTDLPVSTESEAWASVVCEDTECWVDVEFTSVPDAGDEALELWVIDSGVENMHSLGFVTESGRFDLPEGVLPEDFPIVDISVEPLDGVETHSGKSVLRGSFKPA